MFENREILIVTKHKKEKVISPLISKHLKAKASVATHFDTDTLGTFCGEIERNDDPIPTLRMKCKKGTRSICCTKCFKSSSTSIYGA